MIRSKVDNAKYKCEGAVLTTFRGGLKCIWLNSSNSANPNVGECGWTHSMQKVTDLWNIFSCTCRLFYHNNVEFNIYNTKLQMVIIVINMDMLSYNKPKQNHLNWN